MDGGATVLIAAFLLASYSLLAALCIGGQLPAFAAPVACNAPEVVHLRVHGVATDALVRTGLVDRPVDRQSMSGEPGHVSTSIISGLDRLTVKKTAAVAVAFQGDVSPSADTIARHEDWLDARLTSSQWYRTVVLII